MATTRVTGQQVGDGQITDADVAAANKDGTTSTPSLRTLGTGAQQACAGNDSRLSLASAPGSGFTLINGTLTASVAANALTIAVKTLAGADPSSGDPVIVWFRHATASDGSVAALSITSATSLVISSGSTLGSASGVPFNAWIVGFNDGGTFRLGAIKCTGSATMPVVMPLPGTDLLVSSTAEGGAGGADSSGVIYTGTAVTSKPYQILGYMQWGSGLATAGAWASGPTKIQLYGPGVPLPGDRIYWNRATDNAMATGSNNIPADDTIPTSAEGNTFSSMSHTPFAAPNVIVVTMDALLYGTGALFAGIFKDSGGASMGAWENMGAARSNPRRVMFSEFAGSTSARTYYFKAAQESGTVTYNGYSGARYYGGSVYSTLYVEEFQG